MLNYQALLIVLFVVAIHSYPQRPRNDQAQIMREHGRIAGLQNVLDKAYVKDPSGPTMQGIYLFLKAICEYHRRVRTNPFPKFCNKNFVQPRKISLSEFKHLKG